MSQSLLSIRDYGVAFGDRIILNGINLDIPERGMTVLLGPAGTGKSTLLRTIAGHNDANPTLRTWGDVFYADELLRGSERPALVAQKTRLMMASVRENIVNEMPERHSLNILQQRDVASRLLNNAGLGNLVNRLDDNAVDFSLGVQRHLAIARFVAANPKLIFVDEPTTHLDNQESQKILRYLIKEAQRRSIVVVVHNQQQAIQLGGQTVLLAGGWIQENQTTTKFFKTPQSQAAKDYVRSGSCSVPAPDTPEKYLDDTIVDDSISPEKHLRIVRPKIPDKAKNYKSDAFGPRNFLWLRKGELAGTPRPGLFVELDYDLTALKRVGISVLVSLTQIPIDPTSLVKHGIKGIAFPIKDMGVPTIEVAKKFCHQIESLIDAGEAVALHCKAGIGRTGTMLVAQLIWEGETALHALEVARRIEPRWVQSDVQINFLEEFAQELLNSSDSTKGRCSASSLNC
ncbi:hypothetical protein MNBD_GAMMA12-1280 [hydrothermal vent metagenome]|uniref:ABC transporter domain-containing protein n=1 Tax=hydrothermal vent metagenome TaxID=652676 RepID=A0A3B0YRP3_9ZZZZ